MLTDLLSAVDLAGDALEDQVESLAVADLVVVERDVAAVGPVGADLDLALVPRRLLDGVAVFFDALDGHDVGLHLGRHAHEPVERRRHLPADARPSATADQSVFQ